MSTRIDRRPVLVAAILVACAASVRGAQAQTPMRAASLASPDVSAALETTARDVEPAVVEIFTTAYTAGPGIGSGRGDLVATQRASGSGVVVAPDGYIVTNAHVVRGAHRLRVELPEPSGGHSILAPRRGAVPATLVGMDLETDLAVIKIETPSALPALSFADSDELKPGQMVMAFGSPMGLHNSVSLGIVSAVARQLEPESPMIYVQTDAAINHGSSGGPLVDLRGRLVGINTLILSQAGGSDGLGFAAPGNIVRTVYEQIRLSGRVHRGDIGVRAQTVTPEMAAGLRLPRGDLVAALDVLRDETTMRVAVTLLERPDLLGLADVPDPRANLVPRLGIVGVDLDPRTAGVLPALRVGSGVIVVSMAEGAIDARDGGLAQGDIIFAINRTPADGLHDLRAALDGVKPGDAVVLHLERRGELLFLAFTAE